MTFLKGESIRNDLVVYQYNTIIIRLFQICELKSVHEYLIINVSTS